MAKLVSMGHQRIAVALPDTDAMLGVHFKHGYLQGLQTAEIPRDDSLILHVASSEAGGFEFGRRLASIEPRPTAALICSESATVGFYGALANAGLIPGIDVSIIVFRENPQVRFLQPAPACYHAELPALGKTLASMVLDLLQSESSPAYEKHLIWPMTYIPGATIFVQAQPSSHRRPDSALALFEGTCTRGICDVMKTAVEAAATAAELRVRFDDFLNARPVLRQRTTVGIARLGRAELPWATSTRTRVRQEKIGGWPIPV